MLKNELENPELFIQKKQRSVYQNAARVKNMKSAWIKKLL